MSTLEQTLKKEGFYQTGQYFRINKKMLNIYRKINPETNASLDKFILADDENILIDESIKPIFEDTIKAYIDSLGNERTLLINKLIETSKPLKIKNFAQFKRLLDTDIPITTIFKGSTKQLLRTGKEVLRGLKDVPARDMKFFDTHATLDDSTYYFITSEATNG